MMFCLYSAHLTQKRFYLYTTESSWLRVKWNSFCRLDLRSTQMTFSSSRSSIRRSCDGPVSCSGGSSSSPLSPRCNSSQQLDSSEDELWDASSDSNDDDEYDLTIIVIVVCGRVVMFGDLHVAWASRARSFPSNRPSTLERRLALINYCYLECCTSSTEERDKLLKDRWRRLFIGI